MPAADVHAWNPTTLMTFCGRAGDEIRMTLTAGDVTCGKCRALTGFPPGAEVDSNTSSQQGLQADPAEEWPAVWLRKLQGVHVYGGTRGGVETFCWRCGMTGKLGNGRDAVNAAEVAGWCEAHECAGLAVT